MNAGRVSTCVWRATEELLLALDASFGEPLDAYLNGSQSWLREDGPGGMTLEWRLHPVAGFRQPAGVASHHELFAQTTLALSTGAPPPAPLAALWDGLEVFAAYGDEIEPAPLAEAATAALGVAPDALGLVDHEAVAEAWDRSNRTISLTDAVLAQLRDPV